MTEWIDSIRQIDLAMAASVIVAAAVSLLVSPRGGRFRGLLGWSGSWVLFGTILYLLSHAWATASLSVLGLLMFGGLRTYFSLAPLRPRDRYAIVVAYLAIPFALYPGLTGKPAAFLATVPVVVFMLFPVLLSMGESREGLLDSMGRILLGVLLFVFCAAHLGLLVGWRYEGCLALFGILVLAAELPQRLMGRWRPGNNNGRAKAAIGVAMGAVLAAGLGFRFGPWCGIVEEDGARAGLLVAIAVTMGAMVAEAALRDLGVGAPATRIGRGALLDRAIPVLYAAPVFFHYLNYFA
ncbi:MAG: hypothetical protein GY723_02640 [bacterium]|nr:hypothetical protein [bacterium]